VTESSPPRADGIRPAPCGRGPARRSADRGLPRIAPFFKDGPDRTHLAVDPLLFRFQLAEGLSQGGRYPRLILASFRGPLLQGELLTPRALLHATRACHPKTSPKHSRSILAFSPHGCYHAKCDGTARPSADREDLPTGRTTRLGLIYPQKSAKLTIFRRALDVASEWPTCKNETLEGAAAIRWRAFSAGTRPRAREGYLQVFSGSTSAA
jgi:hypothetical protein